MKRHIWRLLEYSSDNAAMNLAIDEAILRALLEDHMPETCRLWQNPPSVIVGRFQDVHAHVNIEACQRRNLPVLRRVSGGGTVYQDHGNLNYSLMVRTSSLPKVSTNVENSYGVFCGGLIEGLKLLGLDAYHRKGDVLIDGRKVSGSAQHRLYDVILHHGTLLVNVDLDVLETLWERRMQRSPAEYL